MKIAVYYPWVYLTSGIERTIVEVCKRSRHDYTVFTNCFQPETTFPEFDRLRVVRLAPVSVKRDLRHVLLAALVIGKQRLDVSGFDALLVHCDGLGDLVMAHSLDIPTVCFCHTPLRAAHDSRYQARVMERSGWSHRLLLSAFARAFRYIDRRMWKRYRYVLFNSAETRDRAEKGGLLRGLEERCEVLHPGIEWSQCQPSWRYERYFLVPGRIMWTKNIELAIEAFKEFTRMRVESRGFRLVIAGAVDEKSAIYLESLRYLSIENGTIEFVISPSDAAMRELYANCYAVLFPAFNEDWGIVPLEANAFGKAVIACDAGGPRESQQHLRTGYLVDGSPHAFALAMTELLDDPSLPVTMGVAARQNAQKYDWGPFVRRLDDVLETVSNSARGVHSECPAAGV